MTNPTPAASDLDGILARTRHLLLDFDGPICSIFAGLPAATIADRLRKLFGDHALIPDDIASTPDPFEVFLDVSLYTILYHKGPLAILEGKTTFL